jgi:hypothetical protein
MHKLKLELDALAVESFEPNTAARERGTVRGQLTAYYEICSPDDTWQQSCTCEPTCNARTCYNCSVGCGGTDPSICQPQSIPLTNCALC